MGTRAARSGLHLAPDIQNQSQEWNSGNSNGTKWPTVGSGHPEWGLGMEFWDVTIFSVLAWLGRNDDESHEVR